MNNQNAFASRGRSTIDELARGERGRSAELNELLARFLHDLDMDSVGILIEELRSHVANFLPNATVDEARYFAQKASYAEKKRDQGRRVGVTIQAYQATLEYLISKENHGGSDDTGTPDDGMNRGGPGNQSSRNIKDHGAPR